MATTTAVFYELLRETLGVTPVDGPPPTPATSGPLRGKKLDTRLIEAAYNAVPGAAELDDPLEQSEAATELQAFDARLRVRSRGGDMASVPRGLGLAWSRDAPGLRERLRTEKRLGGPSAFTGRAFLLRHFTELKLGGMGLQHLDRHLLDFAGLRELNVSTNNLTCLENLPAGLVSVVAYANAIDSIGPPTAGDGDAGGGSPLLHVGLGYNVLGDDSVYALTRLAPEAVVVDLAYNCLVDLPGTLAALSRLDRVRHLVLYGNPLALVYRYDWASVVLSSMGAGTQLPVPIIFCFLASVCCRHSVPASLFLFVTRCTVSVPSRQPSPVHQSLAALGVSTACVTPAGIGSWCCWRSRPFSPWTT